MQVSASSVTDTTADLEFHQRVQTETGKLSVRTSALGKKRLPFFSRLLFFCLDYVKLFKAAGGTVALGNQQAN